MPAGTATLANTTQQWNDLVRLLPRVWAEGARVALEEVRLGMDLWDEDVLDQFNRDYSFVSSSGFSSIVAEGADYPTLLNNQGDVMSLSTRKYGKAFTVTEDLLDGNKYREISIGMQDLGGVLFRGMALDQHHQLLSFAFGTSHTDRDGNTVTDGVAKATTEALWANTHTMGDGTTYDNLIGASTLNEANFRTGVNLTVLMVDENGELISWGVAGQKYLVTTRDAANVQAAKRLTTQEWEYDAANRNINTWRGEYVHVPLIYGGTDAAGARDSTKDKYWALLDGKYMKDGSIFAVNQRPLPAGPFEDMHNGGMLWRTKTRYDLGVLYGHIGVASNSTT